MNKISIFLETLSFFLVTFDLYNQNNRDEKVKFQKQLSFIAHLAMLPIWVYGFFVIFVIFWNIIFNSRIDLRNTFGILTTSLVITIPIPISFLIIKAFSSYYEEKRKPIFLLIGCILFIISKSISIFVT